jgi:hypothetical protein
MSENKYRMTPSRRAAIDRQKADTDNGFQFTNKFMSGNGHQRYANYVAWCRSRRLPAAPIATWSYVLDKIGGDY